MKKLLLYIEVLILFIFFSCDREKQRNVSNLGYKRDSIERYEVVSEDVNKRKNIIHFDAIKVDTIIRDFHISYTIQDNDDIISRQSITCEGDSILLEYADRSVFLNLICNGQTILSNKEINKQTFKSIISKDKIEEFQLWFFGIKEVEDEGVLFNINICIPDTDMCYFLALHISKKGNFLVSEIEMEEEFDD